MLLVYINHSTNKLIKLIWIRCVEIIHSVTKKKKTQNKYLHVFLCQWIFFFFLHYAAEQFGDAVNQTRKNTQDENKNKHISYNNSTVFNSKDYLVWLFSLFLNLNRNIMNDKLLCGKFVGFRYFRTANAVGPPEHITRQQYESHELPQQQFTAKPRIRNGY